MSGRIHVGMGGWVFEPWRGAFYPEGLKQKYELSYASRHVTAIEINSTFYSTQKPATFARWRSETPEGFVFTLKGSRFVTNRRELATAGEAITRYVEQGITELGSRLGPIFWQFANTKTFDPADFEAFLELLPRQVDGAPLRHAVEVRHDSFRTPAFIALMRRHAMPVIYADHATYPAIPDVTGEFVYARLQTGVDSISTCYAEKDLEAWAGRLKTWAEGGLPADLEPVDAAATPERKPREVFAFLIHEGKVRAPSGAEAIIARLGPEHAPRG